MLTKTKDLKTQKYSERTVEHYETVLKYNHLVGCVKPSPRLQPTRERKFTGCLANVPPKQPTQQSEHIRLIKIAIFDWGCQNP